MSSIIKPAPRVLVFSLDDLSKTSPVGEDGEVLLWSPSRHCSTPLKDIIEGHFGANINITQAEPSYSNAAIKAELAKPEWASMVEVYTWLVASQGLRLCAIKLLAKPDPICRWVSCYEVGDQRDD